MIDIERVQIRSKLNDLLNPNVDAPEPKLIEICKIAIKLPEYDYLRVNGEDVRDLDRPAP